MKKNGIYILNILICLIVLASCQPNEKVEEAKNVTNKNFEEEVDTKLFVDDADEIPVQVNDVIDLIRKIQVEEIEQKQNASDLIQVENYLISLKNGQGYTVYDLASGDSVEISEPDWIYESDISIYDGVLSVCGGDNVYLFSVDASDSIQHETYEFKEAKDIHCSPDLNRVVYLKDGEVFYSDITGENPNRISFIEDYLSYGKAMLPRFIEDNRILICKIGNYPVGTNFLEVNLDDDTVRTFHIDDHIFGHTSYVDNSSDYILYSAEIYSFVIDINELEIVKTLELSADIEYLPEFNHTKQKVLYVNKQNELCVYDIENDSTAVIESNWNGKYMSWINDDSAIFGLVEKDESLKPYSYVFKESEASSDGYQIIPLLDDVLNDYYDPYLLPIYKDGTVRYFYAGESGKDKTIAVLDNQMTEVLKMIEMDEELTLPQAFENSQGELLFRCMTESGYDIYNDDFELVDQWFLPDDILELKDERIIRDWDASGDFDQIAYTSNSSGLELYDVERNKTLHIADNNMTLEQIENNYMYGEVNAYVEFIYGDNYLSVKRVGYEYSAGYDVYNIKTGNLTALNGVFDFVYDGNWGCYIYEDNGIKATTYDYDKDERTNRGMQGNFAMSEYQQGFNDMVDHYLISGEKNHEAKIMDIYITDLRNGHSKKLIQIQIDLKWDNVPKVIGIAENRVFIYLSWMPEHKLRAVQIPDFE